MNSARKRALFREAAAYAALDCLPAILPITYQAADTPGVSKCTDTTHVGSPFAARVYTSTAGSPCNWGELGDCSLGAAFALAWARLSVSRIAIPTARPSSGGTALPTCV